MQQNMARAEELGKNQRSFIPQLYPDVPFSGLYQYYTNVQTKDRKKQEIPHCI